ncbi:peptidase M20 [Lentzea sp. NBRC 105346]|uniref:M20/M25/M40 family metallo-hydrolase n=1 Tax=Lentzea sp. NBRC 105346 TaxID=3032205 RepID=UPI0024A37141|nr:M20/M25/M40 family metallo-hydrolase [Lentzea sp. NBRC 105346]GLZ33492.1 peptidase M20 [Lentzea sp. NBRC 105346]
MLARALGYAAANRRRFIDDVVRFAAIPSVSADPGHRADVHRAATWLVRRLRRAGLSGVRAVRTGGHPLVVARADAGRHRPTVLVYGHYDVQPPGPLVEWHSPPFTPTLTGDLLYGRGVSDDKGQLLTHVAAVESWLRTAGRPPVNVRYVFDGEEEIGSRSSMPFLDRMNADLVVISDTEMAAPDVPSLTISLRGNVKLTAVAQGRATDLHAGRFGGAVPQAALELSRLLASLSDHPMLRPARDFASGPALTVTSLRAGSGAGAIPARACATLDIRIGPDQRPEQIERFVRRFFRERTCSDVRVGLRRNGSAAGFSSQTDGWAVAAAARACRRGFGHSPVLVRSGGSIPVAGRFAARGIPVLLLGFGLPDSRMHAPDERLSLHAFTRGVDTATALLHELSQP